MKGCTKDWMTRSECQSGPVGSLRYGERCRPGLIFPAFLHASHSFRSRQAEPTCRPNLSYRTIRPPPISRPACCHIPKAMLYYEARSGPLGLLTGRDPPSPEACPTAAGGVPESRSADDSDYRGR